MTTYFKKIALTVMACLISTAIFAQAEKKQRSEAEIQQKVNTEIAKLNAQLVFQENQEELVRRVLISTEHMTGNTAPAKLKEYVDLRMSEILNPAQLEKYHAMNQPSQPANTKVDPEMTKPVHQE